MDDSYFAPPVHRSPRVARRTGPSPVRARRVRRHRDALLALLPARGAVRRSLPAQHRRRGRWSDEAAWSPADPLGSDVAHALAAGASFVVSNQGHDGPDATHLDRWIHHYGANVAVAEYSRVVAESVYGVSPHHGYIYGGSGGAGRTIVCLEHAPVGLYDGAVVYILPHVAQQVLGAYVAETARVLGDVLPDVVDATAPGGSGDPFRTLTAEQRVALSTLYKLGFPRGAEDQIHPVSIAVNGVVPGLRDLDPGYFDDFWTEPGYAGSTASVQASRIQREYAVAPAAHRGEYRGELGDHRRAGTLSVPLGGGRRVAWPEAVIGVVLAGLTPRAAVGANLTVRTGAAAGRELLSLGGGDGVIVAAGGRRNMSIGFEDVAIGDSVLVDNCDFLAYANFTRHQNEDIPELDVFRVDGRPVFPQRARADGIARALLRGTVRGRVRPEDDRRAEHARRAVLAVRDREPAPALHRASWDGCRSAGVVHGACDASPDRPPSARRPPAGAQHPTRRLPRSRASSGARHDRLGRGWHRAITRHELPAVG